MKTENFRDDILSLLANGKFTKADIVRLSGVPQSTLSEFLSGKRKNIGSHHIFKLWPIVYGKPLFPEGGKHEEG